MLVCNGAHFVQYLVIIYQYDHKKITYIHKVLLIKNIKLLKKIKNKKYTIIIVHCLNLIEGNKI